MTLLAALTALVVLFFAGFGLGAFLARFYRILITENKKS